MTDLDEFRENWKVELGLKENEKLNQGKIAQILLKLIKYHILKCLKKIRGFSPTGKLIESEFIVADDR